MNFTKGKNRSENLKNQISISLSCKEEYVLLSELIVKKNNITSLEEKLFIKNKSLIKRGMCAANNLQKCLHLQRQKEDRRRRTSNQCIASVLNHAVVHADDQNKGSGPQKLHRD